MIPNIKGKKSHEFATNQYAQLVDRGLIDVAALRLQNVVRYYSEHAANHGKVKVIMRDGKLLDPPEWIDPWSMTPTPARDAMASKRKPKRFNSHPKRYTKKQVKQYEF